MWIHVQKRTATFRGPTYCKKSVQADRSTSKKVTATYTGPTYQRGDVGPRPESYSHVHVPKRFSTGTWILVQIRTTTCTRSTHRKWPVEARESLSKGIQPRAQGQHTEKSRYRHVESRPEAYSNVHKANIPEKAGTCMWIQIQGLTATCSQPTHRLGQEQARGSTFGGLER